MLILASLSVDFQQKEKQTSYLLITNVNIRPHFICMADDGFARKQESFQLQYC